MNIVSKGIPKRAISLSLQVYVIECWSATFEALTLDVCPTEFRADPIYIKLYYVYGYTFVMALGPVVLLVILNTAIIYGLSRQRNVRSSEQTQSSDTITLVLVVFLFIFCNTLVSSSFIVFSWRKVRLDVRFSLKAFSFLCYPLTFESTQAFSMSLTLSQRRINRKITLHFLRTRLDMTLPNNRILFNSPILFFLFRLLNRTKT